MSNALQTFDALVEAMCASLQASYAELIDVTSGSLARALMESGASVALWLQYLNMQVLASTRLATSIGTDIDSWVADFGLTRLAAQPASGAVLMSSLNPSSSSAVVPNGAVVRAADGSVSFIVTGGPYTRQAGTASVTVSVVAATSGVVGNVAEGEISLLGSSISGIDTVTNPMAFSNGADQETDPALRTRFVAFINTRAQATRLAIVTAVESLQLDVSCVVIENTAPDGTAAPGHFTVVMDDGSGTPSSDILQRAQVAVDTVRPVGSTFSVVGPTVISAQVTMTIEIDAQAFASDVIAAISLSITTYVDALGVGAALRLTRLVALAYAASAAVTNVRQVTLNGGASDIGGGASQVVRTGQIAIGVG